MKEQLQMETLTITTVILETTTQILDLLQEAVQMPI
jgi:hypothetical protein